MSASTAMTDPMILKILNGVQAGVEVSLADSTYSLGSGVEDDIQLIDVSLKAGHAKLRIGGGKAEIAAGAGALTTSTDGTLAPGSDWRTLEPLEVVTCGTTRFALGPRSANWTTVGEDLGTGAPARTEAKADALAATPLARLRVVALPMLALVFLAAFAGWYMLSGGMRLGLGRASNQSEIELVRSALDAFPFGRTIETRQEVDGIIYAEGYVSTPVERRALSGALDKTNVPVRVRLYVLQSMRNEITQLIAAAKLNVTADLSDQGIVTLNGLILDQASADAFADRLKDQVLGTASVVSHIKTGPSLLADVQRLADASQLKPWLLLRLDKDLIEVSGAIPAYRVDSWVGFLQEFQHRFADAIALRSFVQLQTADGKLVPAPTSAITLGRSEVTEGDVPLDPNKLSSGNFNLGDVFIGGSEANAYAADPVPIKMVVAATTEDAPSRVETPAQAVPAQPTPPTLPTRAANGAKPTTPKPTTAVKDAPLDPASLDAEAAGQLRERARVIFEALRNGTLGKDVAQLPIFKAILALNAGFSDAPDQAAVPDWYLPLLKPMHEASDSSPCWAGTDLRPEDLLPALFWLDLLSATDTLSLQTLSKAQQMLLLEVALDPQSVLACSKRFKAAEKAANASLYLREIGRNPGFVRFISRSLPAFSLDVAGASLAQNRFILTRAGLKMYEGAAPDFGSRIALIGELGLAIQSAAGLSTVIFGPDMEWQVSDQANGPG